MVQALGYEVVGGPDPVLEPHPLRESYSEVVLQSALQRALVRLNPDLPSEALDDAFHRLTPPEGLTLRSRDRSFRRMLVSGVNIQYRVEPVGSVASDYVRRGRGAYPRIS